MSEAKIELVDTPPCCPYCQHTMLIHDSVGRCWISKCEYGKEEGDER